MGAFARSEAMLVTPAAALNPPKARPKTKSRKARKDREVEAAIMPALDPAITMPAAAPDAAPFEPAAMVDNPGAVGQAEQDQEAEGRQGRRQEE